MIPSNQNNTYDLIDVESGSKHDKLRLTICTSFIIEPIHDFIEFWSKEMELSVEPVFTPYNQVFQQLVDTNSMLHYNNGLNCLLIRFEDWLRERTNESLASQLNFLNLTYEEFSTILKHSIQRNKVPYLIGIVPPSDSISTEIADQIFLLNQKLVEVVKDFSSVHLIDLQNIATLYEVTEMFDTESDRIGHIPFTSEYFAALGTFLARKVRAYISPSFKVIAFDCDNTIWKGICGEVGPQKVVIDDDYSYLQEFLIRKYHEGFLLVLSSKNNEGDVWKVFDHNISMKLKREHIAAHRINWDNKSGNLLSLANELNVGIDSFIFLDDSHFEIEQVNAVCPEICSICLPENSALFYCFLNHVWAFDLFGVTEDDKRRNNMYQVEKQRKQEQLNYDGLDDFMQSLFIQIEMHPLQNEDSERAHQLTLRTNQFNLNGIRKTREEILNTIEEKKSFNRIIKVKDRFGDYGISGLLLASIVQDNLVISTFLLSCRVLGRNVEDLVLTEIKNYCAINGVREITANFRSTDKNQPFFEFLMRTNWITDNEKNIYNLSIREGVLS